MRLANGRKKRGCPTFWDCSHSQGHGNLKVVDGTTDPGAPMDGIVEVANVDEPHGHADEGDDLGELLPKLIQLLLQRGPVLLCGGHLVTDLPNLSVHTSRGHNAYGLTSCNVGALGGGRRGRESGDAPRAASPQLWVSSLPTPPCLSQTRAPGLSARQLALEASPRKACSSYPG